MKGVSKDCDDGVDECFKPKGLPKYPYDGEIVIAGCSSRMPDSANIDEFTENLFNKKHMVTTTEAAGRYENGLRNAPMYLGAVPDADKYDTTFFGMYPSMAFACDPQSRMLLEKAYEAIIDAGESWESMRGTRTGVFIGSLPSDSSECGRTEERMNGYTFIGYTHCHMSNRISFFFDFKGASFSTDCGNGSGLAALEIAMMHIRLGNLDYAVVGSTNIVQDINTTVAGVNAGLYSFDGKCRAFDANASGHCRADGVAVMLISKKELAKRSYCTVLHVRGTNDGYTKDGFKAKSSDAQSKLLQNIYTDMGIDPNKVAFVEAHGACNPEADKIEADALADVLCSNRKTPLLVGSVNTNMGHADGCAAMAGLVKVLIACERKMIPPSLHYEKPHPNIKALSDGRIKILTEAAPFEKGLISINSIGVGGTNFHATVRPNMDEKRAPHPASKVPRLFVYGARTEPSARKVLEESKKYPENVEYQALLEASSNLTASRCPYRIYTVLNSQTGEYEGIKKLGFNKRPVWLSFAGMGCQWKGMGKQMMELPPFRDSMVQSANILKKVNFNLFDLEHEDPVVGPFVGITAVSMALYDCLAAMGIKPDGIFGHSLGEAACAYADGGLSAEEVLLLSYWRGKAAQVSNMPAGKMMAVGMTWEEAKAACPEGCNAACYNAENSVTISGLAEPMTKLLADLQAKGTFAREVNSLGKAFHSPCCNPLGPIIAKELEGLVKPKKRSPRWLSTSVPEEEWETRGQDASIDYFINNLTSTVLYHEIVKKVPQNAVVIEVAPRPLFASLLKRSIGGDVVVLTLMKEGHENNVEYFLDQMGQAYLNDVDVNPLGLYPRVQFPVPRGTPHVSPLVSKMWDHSVSWFMPSTEEDRRKLRGKERSYIVDVNEEEHAYLKGHKVNGEIIYPPAACLVLAWKTLASIKNRNYEEMPVIMKDLRVVDNYILPETGETIFRCRIQSNGFFEVSQVDNFKINKSQLPDIVLLKGSICCPDDDDSVEFLEPKNLPEDVNFKTEDLIRTGEEVYRCLKVQGRDCEEEFKGISRANFDYSQADVRLTSNWTTHLDSVLQCVTQSKDSTAFCDIATITTLQIDPALHRSSSGASREGKVVRVKCDSVTNMAVAGGIVIYNMDLTKVAQRLEPYLCDKSVFVPYNNATAVADKMTQAYASDCSDVCVAGLSKLAAADAKSDNVPNKKEILSVIGQKNGNASMDGKLSKYLGNPKSGLAHALDMIFKSEVSKDFSQNVRNILQKNRSHLSADMLLSSLSDDHVLQPALEIVLDNTPSSRINALEIGGSKSMLYAKIPETIRRNPLKSLIYTVADTEDLKIEEKSFGIQSLNWNFSSSTEEYPGRTNDVVIIKNILHKQMDIKAALNKLTTLMKPRGFLLVQEITQNFPIGVALEYLDEKLPQYTDKRDIGCFLKESSWARLFKENGFEIIFSRNDGVLSSLFLLRKARQDQSSNSVVNLSCADGNWLSEVQEKYNEVMQSPDNNARLWICADPFVTGVTGFFKALCLESGQKARRLKCIVNADSQKVNISPGSKEFNKLVALDLALNEYKDGVLGFESSVATSTDVRDINVTCSRAQLTMEKVGDLSTFRYQQMGPSRKREDAENANWTSVYYASISPKNISVARGNQTTKPNGDDVQFGYDFTGRSKSGLRIMGFGHKTIATEVDLTEASYVPIPESISMKDASTILTAYGTALLALKVKTNVIAGQTILIHDGAETVGQAAIAICLRSKLQVFTTVNSEKQKKFLKQKFPSMANDHIATSEGLTFETQFLNVTDGKGVDIVLNTIDGDKEVASLRLVADGGQFIDLVQNKKECKSDIPFDQYMATKSLISVDFIDTMTSSDCIPERTALFDLLAQGLKNGEIKPLEVTVFDALDVEKAFRHAVSVDDTSVTVLQFKEEEKGNTASPSSRQVQAIPRFECDPNKSYLVVGGLGGFGLHLAQWLIQRGCVNLVLTDSGSVSSFVNCQMKLWERSGVRVLTSTETCSTMDSTKTVITLAETLGPLGGIFLATKVNEKTLLREQSQATNQSAHKLKIQPIKHLDAVTREQNRQSSVHVFVAFTSLEGGRGQAKKTSSAFANAYIDRVCKKRAADGLAACSIQLGTLEEMVVQSDSWKTDDQSVCGTEPQSLRSVLKALDISITGPQVVTSTFVLPRGDNSYTEDEFKGTNLQLFVADQCGVPDLLTCDPNTTLADLGVDSLIGSQIKNILDQQYKYLLSISDITQLTIDDLAHIDESI